MGLIADFWLGKEVTKEFDVGVSVANCRVDGYTYFITREGAVFGDGYLYKSEDALDRYLSDNKSLIKFDDGSYTATCNIDFIQITTTPKIISWTYRE